MSSERKCPFCSRPAPVSAPYPSTAQNHRVLLECEGCRKLVYCYTFGDKVESVKPGKRFAHWTDLRRGGDREDWRFELSDISEEACTSHYLDNERAAAVCLRIALENIVNIHLLGADKNDPGAWKGTLERRLKKVYEGEGNRQLNTEAKECAEYIRQLGNGAAHPGAEGSVLTNESNVTKGIKKLEKLIQLVNV